MKTITNETRYPYFLFPVYNAGLDPLHQLLQDAQLISLGRKVFHGIFGEDPSV